MAEMRLRCMVPRLEAAIDPALAAPCPHCGELVCAPGYWCDDCGKSACPTMQLDDDHEPDADEEPDPDHVDCY